MGKGSRPDPSLSPLLDSLQYLNDQQRNRDQEKDERKQVNANPASDLNQAGQQYQVAVSDSRQADLAHSKAVKRDSSQTSSDTDQVLSGISFYQLGKRDSSQNPTDTDLILRGFSFGQLGKRDSSQNPTDTDLILRGFSFGQLGKRDSSQDPTDTDQLLRGFSFGQLGKRDSSQNPSDTDQLLRGFSFGQLGKRDSSQNPTDTDQLLRGFSFGQPGKRDSSQNPTGTDQLLRGFSSGQLGKQDSGQKPADIDQILRGFSFGQLDKQDSVHNQAKLYKPAAELVLKEFKSGQSETGAQSQAGEENQNFSFYPRASIAEQKQLNEDANSKGIERPTNSEPSDVEQILEELRLEQEGKKDLQPNDNLSSMQNPILQPTVAQQIQQGVSLELLHKRAQPLQAILTSPLSFKLNPAAVGPLLQGFSMGELAKRLSLGLGLMGAHRYWLPTDLKEESAVAPDWSNFVRLIRARRGSEAQPDAERVSGAQAGAGRGTGAQTDAGRGSGAQAVDGRGTGEEAMVSGTEASAMAAVKREAGMEVKREARSGEEAHDEAYASIGRETRGNGEEQTNGGGDLYSREIDLVLRGFSFGQLGRRRRKRFLLAPQGLRRGSERKKTRECKGKEKERENEVKKQRMVKARRMAAEEEDQSSKIDNQFRQWFIPYLFHQLKIKTLLIVFASSLYSLSFYFCLFLFIIELIFFLMNV
jgi:hypothetical protein